MAVRAPVQNKGTLFADIAARAAAARAAAVAPTPAPTPAPATGSLWQQAMAAAKPPTPAAIPPAAIPPSAWQAPLGALSSPFLNPETAAAVAAAAPAVPPAALAAEPAAAPAAVAPAPAPPAAPASPGGPLINPASPTSVWQQAIANAKAPRTASNNQWTAYLDANPEVAANYANTNKSKFKTPEDWAKFHYEHYGKKMGLGFGAAAVADVGLDQLGALSAPAAGGAPTGALDGAAPAAPATWNDYFLTAPGVRDSYYRMSSKDRNRFNGPDEYAEYYYRAHGTGTAPTLDNTYTFRTNDRKTAGVVTADPNTTYRLWDERGKTNKIISSGQGAAGLDEIYRQATQLSTTGGKKANWGLEALDPATGQWKRVAEDDPSKGGILGTGISIGDIAKVALPIAGAVLLPGIGGAIGGALTGTLGTAGTAGLGAALGSAAYGTAKGQSIGKILKNAAISGVGSAAGAGLIGGGTFGSLGKGVSGALGASTGSAAGSAAGTAAGSAVGGLTDDAITVIGSKLPALVAGGAGAVGAGALAGVDAVTGSSQPSQPTEAKPEDIVVKAPTAPVEPSMAVTPPIVIPPAPTAAEPPAQAPANEAKPEDEIVVSADKAPALDVSLVSSVAGGLVDAGTMDAVQKLANEDLKANPDKKGLTVADIAKYLKLASLVVGLGGSLFDKGKSAAGKIPGGLGGLGDDSAFTGSLPDLTASQSAIMRQTPRQMPVQDWSKYGFRPEQSFFTGTRPGYDPPAPGVEDPRFPSIGQGYAKGGRTRSLAVRGPGTERSDSIPAMLSDGEYVIDAPTVRAIGSGSREKGFKRLDDLRVHVRKKAPKKALKSLGAR